MSFSKIETLESLIAKINDLLEPVEIGCLSTAPSAAHPTIAIIGCPRAGGTLFTQWMATLPAFSFPNNFVSRFPRAPYLALLISKMVTHPDFQYKDEFSDIRVQPDFKSDLGKTSGFNSPHEFWYFWRRFFDFQPMPADPRRFAAEFDFQTFRRELALMQTATGAPLVLKAHIVNHYIPELNEAMGDSMVYLHLTRNPVHMAHSVLLGRERWNGSKDAWWSWKPREHDRLEGLDLHRQVAGQIYFIEREVRRAAKSLGERCLRVEYESFCASPEQTYVRVTNWMKSNSPTFSAGEYAGPVSFMNSVPDSPHVAAIEKAFEGFVREFGEM